MTNYTPFQECLDEHRKIMASAEFDKDAAVENFYNKWAERIAIEVCFQAVPHVAGTDPVYESKHVMNTATSLHMGARWRKDPDTLQFDGMFFRFYQGVGMMAISHLINNGMPLQILYRQPLTTRVDEHENGSLVYRIFAQFLYQYPNGYGECTWFKEHEIQINP